MVKNLQTVKNLNRASVLTFIRQHEPVSRRAIARQLGMSPSTASAAVSNLMERGLVRETGQGASTGGRRPILLEIDPKGGLVISVDVAGSSLERTIRAAALDLKSNIVLDVKHRQPIFGNEAMLAAIQNVISELLDSPQIDKRPPLALGISVPGLVDAQTGTLLFTNINVQDLPLGQILHESFQAPVIVHNSEDAAALGEYWFGSGQGCHSLMYLSVGAGVGAGLVVRGKIYQPGRISVGEIGHMTVQYDGPLCHCGNRGCLSALVASEVIVESVAAALRDGYNPTSKALTGLPPDALDIHQVLAAAEAGEVLCRDILVEKAEWVGIAVAAMVNVLNPEVIVLGGELLEGSDFFLAPVQKVVKRRALSAYTGAMRLVRSGLGRNAGLRGVSVLAMEELFRLPDRTGKT